MKELTELLGKLAGKLGTTTEYLWSVLIKQAPINAVCNLFLGCILISATILLSKNLWHINHLKDDENEPDENVYAVLGVLLSIFVLFDIIFLCCFGDILSGLFNPEYWALQEVLKTISK